MRGKYMEFLVCLGAINSKIIFLKFWYMTFECKSSWNIFWLFSQPLYLPGTICTELNIIHKPVSTYNQAKTSSSKYTIPKTQKRNNRNEKWHECQFCNLYAWIAAISFRKSKNLDKANFKAKRNSPTKVKIQKL